jgi:hypothetical protein
MTEKEREGARRRTRKYRRRKKEDQTALLVELNPWLANVPTLADVGRGFPQGPGKVRRR